MDLGDRLFQCLRRREAQPVMDLVEINPVAAKVRVVVAEFQLQVRHDAPFDDFSNLAFTLTISNTGTPSVMQIIRGTSASIASMMASPAPLGGT